MIDVLHLYVAAGVARVVCAAAADNERTNEERSTAGASGPQIQLSRIYRLKSDAICIDCA